MYMLTFNLIVTLQEDREENRLQKLNKNYETNNKINIIFLIIKLRILSNM